jgi:ERCC4-type nuclease
MIRIDRRIGSGHLLPLLRDMGVPAQITKLDYGDAAFEGRGPDERVVPIGIEVKTVRDFLSSLLDGRLMGHQLPGLLANYEHVWLILQTDIWFRVGPDGAYEQRKGKGVWEPVLLSGRGLCWRDVSGVLSTLEIKGGLHIRQTPNKELTARTIAGLYHWWTSKAYEQHRSHLALHEVPDSQIHLSDPSQVTKFAATLPGVGWERAHAIGRCFVTPREMFEADEQAWREVPGIGKVLAARIVEALR